MLIDMAVLFSLWDLRISEDFSGSCFVDVSNPGSGLAWGGL